ncbi:MAG: heterodisulfide reductase-related iron-sulfur binding cluster [Bacteroidota bacterium]|nr:heterodisulfide reductase-related iron-sulfur binding cluster [Bacteroidota bacterium]
MPVYAKRKWTQINRKQAESIDGLPDAILLVDTYTQCHQPEVGISAVKILEALGQKVMVLDVGCCQRPRISHGFLEEASALIAPAVAKLKPWLEKNIPIAVLEPGCASAWTDDIPDLIKDDETAIQLKRIMPFEKLLLNTLLTQPQQKEIKPKASHFLVHGHCHQKSIFGMESVRSIFALWPEVKYEEIDSGCCGMAGSFGYEAKHYEVSKKMAERVLIPSILSKPDAIVIANGFSCKHQIADFAERKTLHIAEAFDIL